MFLLVLRLIEGEKPLFASGRGQVAVVKLEGAIFDSTQILEDLEDLKSDKSVKAIVVRVDSPGGAIAPSQEIFEELLQIKKEKKIVVSMGTLAASGGYYVACAADKIFASRGTITGSIGVIMESFGVEDLLKWAKVQSVVLKSGHYKDVGSPFRQMQPDERAFLQNLLDDMYRQFKTAVSTQRKIPMEKLDSLAEGKVYSGEQALSLGLIDSFGTIYDAILEAKKMAGLKEDASVSWPRKEKSPLDFLKLVGEGKWEGYFKSKLDSLSFPVGLYMMQAPTPR